MIESAYVDALQIHRTASLAIASWAMAVSPRPVRTPRARADGDIDATSLRTGRRFNLTGYAKGTTPLAAQEVLDGLAAALEGGSHTLTWRREGDAADLQAVVVLDSDIGAPLAGSRKLVRYEMALFAPDPRMYGATLVGSQRVGSGTWTATNAGTARTPPLLTITGPTNAGALTLANTTPAPDESVVLTGLPALGAGAILLVDMAARTVFYAGAYHPEVVVAASTDWWQLRAGANTLSATGTAMQATTVARADWRTARI